MNFAGTKETGWDWIADPLFFSIDPRSFYIPIIFDPMTPNQMFAGLDFLWRTQDNGGPKAYLDSTCNEFTGTFVGQCGDWVPIGPSASPADALADGTTGARTRPTAGTSRGHPRSERHDDDLGRHPPGRASSPRTRMRQPGRCRSTASTSPTAMLARRLIGS